MYCISLEAFNGHLRGVYAVPFMSEHLKRLIKNYCFNPLPTFLNDGLGFVVKRQGTCESAFTLEALDVVVGHRQALISEDLNSLPGIEKIASGKLITLLVFFF